MSRIAFSCLVLAVSAVALCLACGCTSTPANPTPVPTATTTIAPSVTVTATASPSELTSEEYLKTHPPPPQNVRASFQTDHISLRWDAPVRVSVPHDYSDTVAYYRIYKGTTEKDLTYFTVSSGPAYSDYNVSENNRYIYEITAVMAGDTESSPSAGVVVDAKPVTGSGTEEGLTYDEYRRNTPPPPENLTAVFRGSYIGLRWDAPAKATGPHNFSDTIAFYRIYKGTMENKLTYFTSATGTVFDDYNVSANRGYYYEITAVMAGETESSSGNTIHIVTQ